MTKRKATRMAVSAVFVGIASCSFCRQHLPFDPSAISAIRIGIGFRYQEDDGTTRDARKDQVLLDRPELIRSFLEDFSFGNEHDFTVKHPLSAYVELYAGENMVGQIRFEHRIMRYEKREYKLCRKTAVKLAGFLRVDTSP